MLKEKLKLMKDKIKSFIEKILYKEYYLPEQKYLKEGWSVLAILASIFFVSYFIFRLVMFNIHEHRESVWQHNKRTNHVITVLCDASHGSNELWIRR